MPDVAAENLAFTAMMERYDLIVGLSGGTLGMRAGREKWLPKEEEEKEGSYLTRLNRSILFEGFSDTVDKLLSKPFSRDVVVPELENDMLQGLITNADQQGTNLTQFARSLLDDGIRYGKGHFLVNFPPQSEQRTIAEQRAQGMHPYFVQIKPTQLFDWDTEKRGGKLVLTKIKWNEVKGERDTDGVERAVQYVHEWTETEWIRWKKADQDWAQDDGGTHTFGKIPLVTFYTKRTGFLEAVPPLEALAWLNLAHWQSSSDQRNILRIARCGILYLFGISEEEYEERLVVGPSNFVRSTNSEAKIGYAEHSGKAIGAGRQDLLDLEEQMEVLGLQPLIRKTGSTTAYERAATESKNECNLQSWARALESSLQEGFKLGAEIIKGTLPEDFAADVFSDYGIPLRAAEDLKVLLEMRKAGNISHYTFLQEVKRRGVLSDDVDIEEEIGLVAEEAVPNLLEDEDIEDDE